MKRDFITSRHRLTNTLLRRNDRKKKEKRKKERKKGRKEGRKKGKKKNGKRKNKNRFTLFLSGELSMHFNRISRHLRGKGEGKGWSSMRGLEAGRRTM